MRINKREILIVLIIVHNYVLKISFNKKKNYLTARFMLFLLYDYRSHYFRIPYTFIHD